MTWQLFITLHLPLVTFKVITQRSIARLKNASRAIAAINAVIMTITYALGLIYVYTHRSDVDLAALPHYLPLILTSGLAFALTNYLGLKILSYFDSAVGTVIGTGGLFFTLLFARIWFHERLTGIQFIGAVLLLPVIWYVLLLGRTKTKLNLYSRAVVISLILIVVIGWAYVNEKYLLGKMTVPTYILFGWGAQALMSWVLAGFQTNRLAVLKDKILWWRIGLAGTLTATAGLCFIEALVKSNNVSVVSVISSFRLILIALLAGWFLNERKYYFKKLFASAVASVGVILMLWK